MSSVVSSARRRECPEEVDDDARRVVLHAVARLRRSLLPSRAGRRFPSFSFSESARSRGGVTLAPFILRTYARKRRLRMPYFPHYPSSKSCNHSSFKSTAIKADVILSLSSALLFNTDIRRFPPFRKASSNTHLWIHNNK